VCLEVSGSYTGGGLSPWQVQLSWAGPGAGTRQNRTPRGTPGLGLSVGLTTEPRKNKYCYWKKKQQQLHCSCSCMSHWG